MRFSQDPSLPLSSPSSELDPEPDSVPVDELKAALRHLLKLWVQSSAARSNLPSMLYQVSVLRMELDRAVLPEDYQDVCEQILALESPEAPFSTPDRTGRPGIRLHDILDAVAPILEALAPDAAMLALSRWRRDLADGMEPESVVRALFRYLEHTAAQVHRLLAVIHMLQECANGMLELIARDEPHSAFLRQRLKALHTQMRQADSIEELQAVGDALRNEVQRATRS